MNSKYRVLLVDDHEVVREGIKRLLERHQELSVVGEAHNGEEALRETERLQPDVVVMDLSMPGMSGLEAMRALKTRGSPSRVIALTVHEDEAYVRELLKSGAAGYVLKRAPAEELARAVRTIADGGVYIDSRVADKAVRAMVHDPGRRPFEAQISERETAVLRAIAQGYSHKEIAAELNLSIKTIETYKARAVEKLGLRSRVDIVKYATQRGWLTG